MRHTLDGARRFFWLRPVGHALRSRLIPRWLRAAHLVALTCAAVVTVPGCSLRGQREQGLGCESEDDKSTTDEQYQDTGLSCRRVVLSDLRSLLDNGSSTRDDVPQLLFDPYPSQEFRCGPTMCRKDYPSFQGRDAQSRLEVTDDNGNSLVDGNPCTTLSFRLSITEDSCFRPGVDPDPYEALDLCGDHWMKGVRLSTEWRFASDPSGGAARPGPQHDLYWT